MGHTGRIAPVAVAQSFTSPDPGGSDRRAGEIRDPGGDPGPGGGSRHHGNYFDVVCLHSVVVFVPMFIAWAFLLQRYDFSPNAVFLLFGLTGLTAEFMLSGPQALLEFGLWIFVYGLMVYLPAYAFPADRAAKKPAWWMYIAAVFLPVLFAIPVAAVVGYAHPVKIHFPAILPGS
jgi:hypothetical protein